MARKRAVRRPKPRKVRHKVSIYQIQIKGPQRNEALRTIIGNIKTRLMRREPIRRDDNYGVVIRSMSGQEVIKPEAIWLELARYNQKTTGLAWDFVNDDLIKGAKQATAQLSDLIIYVENHVAILKHKPHGPTPSEMKIYLQSTFARAANELELDCSIDILPLKVGGLAKQIATWKVIKRFTLEFLRPNPNPNVKSKKLKQILKETDADKGLIALETKVSSGLKYQGIKEYVKEGEQLIKNGQGAMSAAGVGKDDKKEEIDSTKEKVRKFDIVTDTDDKRPLAELFYDELKKYFT